MPNDLNFSQNINYFIMMALYFIGFIYGTFRERYSSNKRKKTYCPHCYQRGYGLTRKESQIEKMLK